MLRQYYAHSLEGKPPEEWQPLEEKSEDEGRFFFLRNKGWRTPWATIWS